MKRPVGTLCGILAGACVWSACPPVGPPVRPDPPVLDRPELFERTRILAPSTPLYIGSYARLVVQPGNRDFANLSFHVVEGSAGGSISESVDSSFNPQQPTVMLLVGHKPGTYTLEARERGTNNVVATARFSTTTRWRRDADGPSFVSTASGTPSQVGAAYGDGNPGLQNLNIRPVSGTRRIAMILLDTSSAALDPAAVAGILGDWENHLIQGVPHNGELKSTRRYFREQSFNSTDASVGVDLTLETFGPYTLDGTWQEVGAAAGLPIHIQAAITAADNDIDYTRFDHVLVVSQGVGSGGGNSSSEFAWPSASLGGMLFTTAEGTLRLGVAQMPHNWTALDGRQVFATYSHEFAHNLGLPDLYAPEVRDRNLGDWELMHGDGALPHLSLPHKMMLGWIPFDRVRPFNPGNNTSENTSVTLLPVDVGAPGEGRFSGVELRMSDGHNYYFEYRRPNPSGIGDLNLPAQGATGRIVGYDVDMRGAHVFARPNILLLPSETSGSQAVMDNGQGWTQGDNATFHGYQFVMRASELDGTSGRLQVSYGTNAKPDPSIRMGLFASPDMEVRNARGEGAPSPNNPNTLVARVKNEGPVAAPGVRVNFYARDFSLAGAPEVFLGSSTRDINPQESQEFSIEWTPTVQNLYALVARIEPYTSPLGVREVTEGNNVAEWRYVMVYSPFSSPAERQLIDVSLKNPYDKRTQLYLSVDQTNPLYRTYLPHTWVWLEPNEVRKLTMMVEYAGEPPATLPTPLDEKQLGALRAQSNQVVLRALAVHPLNPHVLTPLGRALIEVRTGRATKFTDVALQPGSVQGRVVTRSAQQPVPSGKVVLTVQTPTGLVNQTVDVSAGSFLMRYKGTLRELYYVPTRGFAPTLHRVQ